MGPFVLKWALWFFNGMQSCPAIRPSVAFLTWNSGRDFLQYSKRFLFSLDQQLERCHEQCKQMSRKWMQMELTQSARWLITFYRSNTRLMTGVTKPVSHYGYHYYYLLFLRVSIEYRGIIYLRVWVCTMPWFLLPKAFHKIDCIGLQKYSLLQQTCRKYSLTFCDRQWWQKLPCG